MSKSHTMFVVAHELMHVYLHLTKKDHLHIDQEELLCDIAAHYVLVEILNDWDLISSYFKGRHDFILSQLQVRPSHGSSSLPFASHLPLSDLIRSV